MPLILRQDKGSKLTIPEMDGNLTYLEDLANSAALNPGNVKGDFLEWDGSAWVSSGIIYTIELIDALTVDFYAPYDLKINTVDDVLNSPTTTIEDDGAPYTLTNTILAGSKVSVTVDLAAVVNLNVEKV